MNNKNITLLSLLKASIFLVLSVVSLDLKSAQIEDDIFDMSLDQLADIEITSVSKKPQKISLAASSIFVLQQEDIKRSGVTTIPDALRLVPGVQVAKLDANKWAISIRGFNDIFSNKLLILMDGRSVYSPFFGGAYWDTIDTVLEDIERIEVVRGPGGTLWGSNAVNGVINIITKNAKDSEGLYISALAGNEEIGKLSIRYGGEIGSDTHYRVYAKGFEKDAAENGVDDWRMGRLGFRIDTEQASDDKFTLQGDIYSGEEGEMAVSNGNLAPFGDFASKTEVLGGNVLLRWEKKIAENSDYSFQFYYDHTDRKHFYVEDQRDTVDLDFQHHIKTFWGQELVWGLGFRYIGDKTSPGTVMELIPSERSDRIYSAFVQDEISLIDEKLILTLGSKVEHNSYTGFEYQPSARLLWKPLDKHSLWGAVSRAVRVPSRMEQDAALKRRRNAIFGIDIIGNSEMKSEELLAYELGYRLLEEGYNFDISFFYNDYDDLRTIERGATIFSGGSVLIPLIVDNNLEGEVYGFDVAASWQLTKDLRIFGGYSYTQMQLHLKKQSVDTTEEGDEGDTPHHQFTLSAFWQLSENWQFDTTLRYVDKVNEALVTEKNSVDSYVTVDSRIAWQFHKSVEFSLIGQNLFGKHREFRGSTVDTQATDVEPSIYFKADLNF